jgi:CHAT domain-containing protein/tetratricopeptide (TPR) repeat protein
MVLKERFDEMWGRVRQANLCGGQPQSASSRESLATARQALSLATEAQDDQFLVEAWCMMAYALNLNEEYLEALSYYRQAIHGLEQAGDESRAGRIRLGFIHALSMTGQSREALNVGLKAARFFRKQKDSAALAKLSTNLGAVYERLNDWQQALVHYTESVDLFRQIGDERSLAQVYHNLGITYCFLDRFAESEEMYQRCESLSCRLGLRDLHAQARYNKAYLYFMSGRFSEALALFGEVRSVFLNSGSRRFSALCDLDEAEIYIQLRLPHDALLLARAAADSFSKLDLHYEQGKAITYAGIALTQKRQFGDALTAFREAQILLEQEGNAFWSAQLDLYRAEVLFTIGRHWEAFSLASDADAKFSKLDCAAGRLVSLVLLGRVSMQLGRLDDAQFYAQAVRDLTHETKVPLFLFACYALSAEIAERADQLETALRFYQRAALEIELRHTHLHHDELGITFYKGKAEVFESLATLTLAFGGEEAPYQAYMWCEKAKSQMFVDALAPHLPSVRSHANEALLARVDRIRGELNSSYLRAGSENFASLSVTRAKEVAVKEDELVRTLGELSEADSEYVSLQHASSIRLEELQQSLADDTAVVEYFFAREEVLAFILSKSKFQVAREVTATKRVQYLVGRMQYQLKKFASVIGFKKSEQEAAALKNETDKLMHTLYRELIEPIAPSIEGRHVVIVPHGVLHRLPFHAFHDGERYLSERFDISYAPSGSVLKYCLDRADLSAEAPLFVRRDSVRENVLRESANAQFIHMEVPIGLRLDNPVLSGIEFADGMFCIPDIYSTQWNTNILSLSLIEPSVEMSGNGDDLLGLLRAFLYAGSRSILLELWRVRPEPADAFFRCFYSEWLAGKSKQQAMRAGQLAVQAEYLHPFYWAPFALAGRP